MTLTIRIDAHRVSLTQTTNAGGKNIKGTLEGDYSVSRDYVLYGFVTGVDVAEGVDADEAGKMVAPILDQPFAVRYRVDGNSLTIRDIKVGGITNNDREGLQVLAGRYKKVTAAKHDTPTHSY